MKLVMVYTETDDATYSCDIQFPFEYYSAWKAKEDFMAHAEKALIENKSEFKFLTEYFTTKNFVKKDGPLFIHDPPDFYTLEDWFYTFRI